MKILYVYEYYAPHIGGGELALQHLTEGVVAQKDEAVLVTARLPHTPKYEELNGVKVYRVWTPTWGSRYWFMWLCGWKVWRLSKDADVIHTFTYSAVPMTWLIARLRNKKIILTVHEVWGKLWLSFSGMNFFSAWLHRLYERAVLALKMNQWVAVSKFTGSELLKLGIPLERLSIIYQGIDAQVFRRSSEVEIQKIQNKLGLKSDTFIYLFFGRPGISKGLEYLILAAPLILKQVPNSKFFLLLSPEPAKQYSRIQKLITQHKLEQHITCLPPVERHELPHFLSAAQCIVVPSVSEGFGFSVAEACAVGTPVVTTSAGSIPEVVSGSHVLVQPASSQALAAGVIQVAQSSTAHTPSKTFDWQTTISAHLKLYQQLLTS